MRLARGTRRRALLRIRDIAFDAVLREDPHWTHPDLADLYRPAKDAHPVFFGAYDWHSAVHSHWALVRWVGLPDGADDTEVADHLVDNLTRTGVLKEVATFASGVLDRFEIPYGLAWVLMLEHELAASPSMRIRPLAGDLRPLADLARRKLRRWFSQVDEPPETGTHGNAAFALGLIRESGSTLWNEFSTRLPELWGSSPERSLTGEVGEYDFVSPSLEALDLLVSTAADPEGAAAVVDRFVTGAADQIRALEPVLCPDPSDGRSSHLLGLNLSRARALAGIAEHLPPGELSSACERAAHRHLEIGLDALNHDHFATTHWIGSFALRALTR
jgi:hypothetical protein